MTIDKIEDTTEAWETGALGRDARYVQAVSPEEQLRLHDVIDEAFGLKPISIRMEVEVLDNLKAIAKHRGLGYQPLIRQILHRWIDCELKQIALESMDDRDEKEVKIAGPVTHQSLPKAA